MKICFGELERVIRAVESAQLAAQSEEHGRSVIPTQSDAHNLRTAALILRSVPLEIEDVSRLRT